MYYDVSLYVYCKPIASIAHVLYTDTQAFIHRHRSLLYDDPWDVRSVSAKRLLIKTFVGEISCGRNFRILPLNAIINDYRGTARFSALRIISRLTIYLYLLIAPATRSRLLSRNRSSDT